MTKWLLEWDNGDRSEIQGETLQSALIAFLDSTPKQSRWLRGCYEMKEAPNLNEVIAAAFRALKRRKQA